MDEREPCPDCGEEIMAGAKVCRFCGWGRAKVRAPQPAAGARRPLALVAAALGLFLAVMGAIVFVLMVL